MRSLFILLAAINLCYLIWGVAFSEKKDPVISSDVTFNAPTLTLLTEKPKEIILRENSSGDSNYKLPTSKGSDEVDPQAPQCFSIGPFFDENKINKLEQKLKTDGFNPSKKSITDKEPKSYWVYLPAAKTMGEAKLTASDLKAAKVKDYFVIRTGKNANAISLGLYNGYNRAKLRKTALQKLGFRVKIKTRYKEVTRHWLDFHETNNNKVNDADWMEQDKDNVLQKVARPCADPLPEAS